MVNDLYKGFKKVAENKDAAILAHENGHRLSIDKSKLNREHRDQLQKLKLHQADGTQFTVPPESMGPMSVAEDKKLSDLESEMQAAKETPSPFAPQETRVPEYEPRREQSGEKYIDVIDRTIPNFTLAKEGEEDLSGNEILRRRLEEKKSQEMAKREQMPTTVDFNKVATGIDSEINQDGLAPQQQPVVPSATTQTPSAAPIATAPSISRTTAPRAPMKALTPDEVISSPVTSMNQKMAAYGQMYMDSVKRRSAADDEFQAAMKSQTVDPNRLYNNMSTGRKIRFMIGMLLGAVGEGARGGQGGNVVRNMLDAEIRKDVDAQKNDRSEKENLYKMHLARLGDEGQAYLQAMNNIRAMAGFEMDVALGKADPSTTMGKMQLQAVRDNLILQSANARSQMAEVEQRKKMMALISSGKAADVDPAQLVNIMVKDEGSRPAVLKEIGDAQNMTRARGEIMRLWDQAAKEQSIVGRIEQWPPIVGRPDVMGTLEQAMTPFFKDIQGNTRKAEKDDAFARLLPEVMDTANDVVEKRKAMLTWMDATSATPFAKSHGLDLSKFKMTNQEDPSTRAEIATREDRLLFARTFRNSTNPEIQNQIRWIDRKYGVK